ncbi:ankyrin repeat-containing domain protein [Mycena latifolia]|nr:ankyrin repeat-containing domain protein [Mycena latifolia]
MAEALGTLASVLQLVDTVLKAQEYLKDFHEAPEEQKKLFSEMKGLKALLVELDKRVTGSPTSAAFQQMVDPLATFETTLELVTEKLGPVDKLSKFTKKLSWTLWSKKEVAGYLEELERIKASINLWLMTDIWDVGQKQISSQDTERQRRILDWMSPLNFLQRQADVYGTLQSGTGEWLLGEAQFQDWESGSGKVLLCHGIPGAGKTVLVWVMVLSLVVNHLEAQARNSDSGLACIYLNHKETETQTITNLLGALAAQLMLGKHIPALVHSLYEHHLDRRTRPNIDEFHKALDLAVAMHPKVYLIIDALDEYPENYRHRFLKYVATLGPKVNIMMTSRPHINLDSQFPNLKTIEIHATEDDIHKYVDTQIQNSVRLSKHIHTRPELCNEIQATIGENAKGMFLLAKLHIESLVTKNTIKAVREALQHLPKDLQHTYDEAMEQINHQTEEDRQLGLLALTWVANTKRPLSVAELQEALAIEPDSTFLDVDNLPDMDIILSACAGLMIVDDTVSVVRLIHYTTQDYFDSIQSEQFPWAHTIIVSTCLMYLSFPEFDIIPDDCRRLLVAHPFLKYAQYCLTHAKGEPELLLKDKLMAFLTGASRFTRIWNDTVPWKGIPEDYYFPPLCISAACTKINSNDDYYGNPLAAASENGHEHVVQFLIQKGADVNTQGGQYGNALQVASQNGHESVVHLLIKKGADVNAQGEPYENALQAACTYGHESVVQVLIKKGADINAQGGNYGNALQVASVDGHESVVQLLIQKGVNVNVQGGFYGNALQAASAHGHESVVQLLIKKGMDVNAQGGIYGNALQAASENQRDSIVQLLIDKGADVNAQGGTYARNALQAASIGPVLSVADSHSHMHALTTTSTHLRAATPYGLGVSWTRSPCSTIYGQELVVQLLIEKGANVNAQGGYYGNALQAASVNGCKHNVVQLLIEKGADVNAEGGAHRNALQAASLNGPESVVHLLIKKGADVNAQGGQHGNALQAASVDGHKSVVQLLIEEGADVNAQGGQYENALQAASVHGHKLVVQLLVEKGADVNAQGGDYGNALQAASAHGHEPVVQLLIKKGVDVNAQGGYYGNALQAASANGHKSVVQLFIEKAANINAKEGKYGTALQAASAKGHSNIVQLLLANQANINAPGGKYGTALQAASVKGNIPVVQLLLDKGANTVGSGIPTLKHCAIRRLDDLESWVFITGLWNMIPRVISEDLGARYFLMPNVQKPDMPDARYTDFRYSDIQTLPDDQIYYETETQIVETKSFPNGIPNEC